MPTKIRTIHSSAFTVEGFTERMRIVVDYAAPKIVSGGERVATENWGKVLACMSRSMGAG